MTVPAELPDEARPFTATALEEAACYRVRPGVSVLGLPWFEAHVCFYTFAESPVVNLIMRPDGTPEAPDLFPVHYLSACAPTYGCSGSNPVGAPDGEFRGARRLVHVYGADAPTRAWLLALVTPYVPREE